MIHISLASDADRQDIYRARHDVYAQELGQHPPHAEGILSDACDDHNLYIVAHANGHLAGFVSVTLPEGPYSLEKYLCRADLPAVPDTLYEVRLLTVCRADRGGRLAGLLMYAALRLIESRNGTWVIGMGRQALRPFYEKAGLHFSGVPIRSGAVDFELMGQSVEVLRRRLDTQRPLLRRMRRDVQWDLPYSFEPHTQCAHGGASFAAIGERFQTLERRYEVVTADVLDAWFPPSPKAVAALQAHLSWLLQASPPADGAGLVQTIAEVRGLPPESIALGAGSSALIYLALRSWLTPSSRVLLPDPTYGEYAHVLERVIGCQVDYLTLSLADDYALDPERLRAHLHCAAPYDLIILVNPNNPTGQFLPRAALSPLLSRGPSETRVWIDEAYLDYIGDGESLEQFAAQSKNVFVCKSLSKCYALSGARAAYLCGPLPQIKALRRLTPPWSVSLPAQVAATYALKDIDYYRARYAETAGLREQLAADLRRVMPGLIVFAAPANWLLCRLPTAGPDASTIAERCRKKNVFLRDASTISARLGRHTLRIAVKDAAQNRRIVSVLADVLA